MMTAIDEDEAHVWYVRHDRIADGDCLARYAALLSAEERGRHQRFTVERARHDYVITRALCRTTLSRYAGVAPARWEFMASAHGRPEIAAPAQTPPLRFNLSNTAGLVACIVTLGADVGVDVEHIDRRGEIDKIAERFFSPSEVAALRALPCERQRLRFFEYWTLKEAYIKARGMGLALPLREFTFHLEADAPIAISFGALDDDADAWQFTLHRPTARHVMATALRRGAGPLRRIAVHETVLLV